MKGGLRERLFSRVCCNKKRGNGFRTTEVVDAQSLKTFKAGMDGTLRSLIYLKMSLLIGGDWTR